MYKVSLIIPIYNVADFVKCSLLSALNQTFDSIEYILVNDCSTDNSMDIVREVVGSHPRKEKVFIYEHTKNQGLSAARNTGLKNATGEYVFFMDSDDEITSDCIEKHYLAVMKDKACFSIANIELVGAKSVHIKDFTDDCICEDLLSSFFLRKWNVSACNKLYLKNFLTEKHLLFQNGILQEDILWSYNVCLHADKNVWIKDRTYIYNIRENSITRSKVSSKKIESMLFILNSMIDDWENGVIERKYKKEFAFIINFYRLTSSLLLLNYSGSKKEAAYYYKQLNRGRLSSFRSFYFFKTIPLRFPFIVFCAFASPLYSYYKRISG